MQRFSIVSSLVLFLSAVGMSQIPTTPTPTPRPGSRQASLPGISADTANYERLQSIELMTPKSAYKRHPLLDPKKGIYRDPSEEETKILAVAEFLLAEYKEFLRGPNTGIVKLNAESSCVSDEDVVVASEKCVAFTIPGAGSAYSFRTESYRLPRLADVILLNGIFRTGGVFQQVLMADLGDVPIQSVTLASNGMRYLVDLKPVRDSDEFTRFDGEISKGIRSDGFLYRNGHPVREDSTYVLRSIAYRGTFFRSIDGIQYNELDFDKRRDVIVAFRVVNKDLLDRITIVWKRLKDVESPKLKVKK